MKYIYIIQLICLYSTVFCQSFPTYQTSFYFEDAIGNKDTIVMTSDTIFLPNEIYDSTAYRGDIVNIANINKPFEVYTIPVGDIIYSDAYLFFDLKFGINPSKYRFYRNVVTDQGLENVFFLFKCQHYPISVTWNNLLFESFSNSDASKGAHFLPDHTRYSNPDIHPWSDFIIDEFKCLRYDGQWTFHLGDYQDYNRANEKVFGFMPNLQDTLFGLLLNMSPYFNCSDVSKTEEVLLFANNGLNLEVNPNPTSEKITFQLGKPQLVAVLISNISGQIVIPRYTIDAKEVEIDVSILKSGIYFLTVQTDNGGITKRFIKV
jgi:Secretion system C-terminal sorting domain